MMIAGPPLPSDVPILSFGLTLAFGHFAGSSPSDRVAFHRNDNALEFYLCKAQAGVVEYLFYNQRYSRIRMGPAAIVLGDHLLGDHYHTSQHIPCEVTLYAPAGMAPGTRVRLAKSLERRLMKCANEQIQSNVLRLV